MSTSALAVVETITAVEFFKPGASKSIIDSLKQEAREIAKTYDVSTPAGEAGLRSLAAKLAKTKNRLDDAGKELASGWKQQAKVVDSERGYVWDEMEALQKEVRQPLTDKENAEKSRIAAHEAAIAAIPESSMCGARETSSDVEIRLQYLEALHGSRDWQEFTSRAKLAIDQEIVRTKGILETIQKREAEAGELAKLRAESLEREQRERDERIAQQAREATEARAAEEKNRIEQEKFAAEARAKQAEAERVASEERAAQAAKDAEERAIRVAAEAEERAKAQEKAAVEAERQRAERAATAEREAAEARERDKKHAAKINNEVLRGIITAVVALDDEPGIAIAKQIVDAIAKGLIPHTKITY